jgi:hypothetical protein
MPPVSAVVEAANRLATKDAASLEVLVGMIDTELSKDPSLKEQAYLEPKYSSDELMGGRLDELRAIGRKILKRWNKELHGLVCAQQGSDQKDREAILGALSLNQAAVIAAVATALLGLGVPAPIAAALAPLIAKKFIWPAKDELCEAWADALGRDN